MDRLRIVIETQRLINNATVENSELIRVITERAQTITGADAGAIQLVEDNHMVCRAVSGSAAGTMGRRLSMEDTISGLCVRTGTCLRCDDTELDSRVDRDACRRAGIRSMVVVPLARGGNVVGVLEVSSEEPNRFDDSDLDVLELMASFIAAAVVDPPTVESRVPRALHDTLTGLPNRALLMDRLQHALTKAQRAQTGMAVFFIDLDNFQSVNDAHGHAAGDDLLCAVARELGNSLRAGDTLARFGGDEFVVICENADEPVGVAVSNRIVDAMRRVSASTPMFGAVTASVGMVWTAGSALDADELLAAADASMYQAKLARRPAAG